MQNIIVRRVRPNLSFSSFAIWRSETTLARYSVTYFASRKLNDSNLPGKTPAPPVVTLSVAVALSHSTDCQSVFHSQKRRIVAAWLPNGA
jgi:hypothetical protein